MTEKQYIAKAYLLSGCPFSFKFLLFMTESQLLKQIEIITLDRKSDDFNSIVSNLEKLSGEKASYPTVEIEAGVFRSDSDQLIKYFAEKHGVEYEKLPILEFYKQGVFQGVLDLYRENIELKSQLKS